MNTNDPALLDRDRLLALLREVGEAIAQQGKEGHLYIVGGAAMALAFDARRVTRDVDAAAPGDQSAIWEAVRAVAERHQLPPDWINTTASAFMTNEEDAAAREITLPGLRLALASPEHLIAMKLRAMRDRDLDDLDTLFRHVGITDPQQAADIHNSLFDDSYIGYTDPEEALYAAQLVFDRARVKGNPVA